MKKFSMVVAFLITNLAHGYVFIDTCYDYGQQGVSYSYQSCVNRNFRAIGNELNIYLSSCSNFNRDGVDYSFTSCIQNNFMRIERTGDGMYLNYCSNFDRVKLGYSYKSCVNSNFRTIGFNLNNQE